MVSLSTVAYPQNLSIAESDIENAFGELLEWKLNESGSLDLNLARMGLLGSSQKNGQ